MNFLLFFVAFLNLFTLQGKRYHTFTLQELFRLSGFKAVSIFEFLEQGFEPQIEATHKGSKMFGFKMTVGVWSLKISDSSKSFCFDIYLINFSKIEGRCYLRCNFEKRSSKRYQTIQIRFKVSKFNC